MSCEKVWGGVWMHSYLFSFVCVNRLPQLPLVSVVNTVETWMCGNWLGRLTGVRGHLHRVMAWAVFAEQYMQERRNLCVSVCMHTCVYVGCCGLPAAELWVVWGSPWGMTPLNKTLTSYTTVHRESERPRTWHTALIALSVFCVKISPKPAPLSWTVNLPQNGFALNLINMGGFFYTINMGCLVLQWEHMLYH